MDVLYYWKEVKADMAAGHIGWFRSSRGKLSELSESFPDRIWVIKTPAGKKGSVQLLACLRWSDKAAVKVPVVDVQSTIFYDPAHVQSVWFDGSDSDEAIEMTSKWLREHFSAAVRANFQGDNGIHALRGDTLRQLEKISQHFASRPFLEEEAEVLNKP
jgi:hypothetical protein